MTLHELTEEYMNLLEMAEDADIDDQLFFDTMDGITGEIEYKFDGYGKVISQMAHDVSGLKEEEARLNARRKAIENRIANMKNHLMDTMSVLGTQKVKTTLFSFGIQNNPPAVVIDDEKKIPKKYWIEQDPKLDKAAIKEMLKSGVTCEFAHLAQSQGLRIR